METFYKKSSGRNELAVKPANTLVAQLNQRDFRMGVFEQFRADRRIGQIVGKKHAEMAEVLLAKQAEELRQAAELDLDYVKKQRFSEYQAAVSELNANIVEASNDMERRLLVIVRDDIQRLVEFLREWLRRIDECGMQGDELEEERLRAQSWIAHAKAQVDGKIQMLMSENTLALKHTLKLLRSDDPS